MALSARHDRDYAAADHPGICLSTASYHDRHRVGRCEVGTTNRDFAQGPLPMASLRLQGIVKRYDATTVIYGIDLEVRDGEFVVFVGPSGCGKSTLLRMIAGLESVSEGELLIDGKRVNDVSAAQRGLAMVFQSYALYPHMTEHHGESA